MIGERFFWGPCPPIDTGHGACNVQGMGKSQADRFLERQAKQLAPHRPPGRPRAAPYSPLGESLSVEAGALAREYQNALACHQDAAKAYRIAGTRLGNATRRLAGARKACTEAGIDVASLQQPEKIEQKQNDHT